jgi:hypothetical protein
MISFVTKFVDNPDPVSRSPVARFSWLTSARGLVSGVDDKTIGQDRLEIIYSFAEKKLMGKFVGNGL